jgi:glycosyltransferase involved in cell wall biosynthesis
MSKMRVWYVSAYDQPKGQSTRTYDYSRELVRRGHDVTMFCNSYCHFTQREHLNPGESWRVEFVDGIRVVWLRTFHYTGNGSGRGINMLTNVWRLIRVTRSLGLKPDVILGPSVPLLTGWGAMYLARKYDVPFIFEVRDVWPDALVDIGGLKKSSVTYCVFRYIEKQLYQRAVRISSTLPYLDDHVRSAGSEAAKIVCIPNGVDVSSFVEGQDYDGGKIPLTVMYVGGFGLDHDVPTIIRAAKILQDEGSDEFRFVIVGGGVRKETCVAEATALGLRNLSFLPPVPKSRLPAVQAHADILVAAITDSPSYRFGLNLNKLCSYFASSRPVLFSGNPPNDPVREAGAGLSIDAEDPVKMVRALRELFTAGAVERRRFGQNARRYAETTLSLGALGNKMDSMLRAAIDEYRAVNDRSGKHVTQGAVNDVK